MLLSPSRHLPPCGRSRAHDGRARRSHAVPREMAGGGDGGARGRRVRGPRRRRRAPLPRLRRPRRLPGGEPARLLLPPEPRQGGGDGGGGGRRGVRHIVRPEERVPGRAAAAPRAGRRGDEEEGGRVAGEGPEPAVVRLRMREVREVVEQRRRPAALRPAGADGAQQRSVSVCFIVLVLDRFFPFLVTRLCARTNVAAMTCRAVRDDDINAGDFTGAEETRSESDRGDDAIFIHGFTSSSSFWAQTVFPEPAAANHRRLIAVDLLGFGDSPKPANCAYTLRDHVEAIERSLVDPLHLGSFHLVSHSMGCTIAIALAAKHPARVKSVTLVAPLYFLPCEERASQVALRRLAEKKLWPPLLFGSAVMSWYEHIGRTICFVVCKNHRFWEWLIKILTRTSGVDIVVRDLTRHTHHSAWHTMHNVICGGARAQDRNLEALAAAGVPVRVVHGDADQVVPVECSSRHLKSKLPHAELRVVGGRDHRTVVFGREEELAQELRAF
uniref:AB hydrolase-1 domain-containing protein n=1 Tax=Aegilops tauschii subsp. strangulata TaxID=200361 RepID=A0A453AKQ0_AEGTS